MGAAGTCRGSLGHVGVVGRGASLLEGNPGWTWTDWGRRRWSFPGRSLGQVGPDRDQGFVKVARRLKKG